MGKKKKQDKEIVRFDKIDQDLLQQLNSESDRGITLIAVSILDNALHSLLCKTIFAVRKRNKDRMKSRDKLFDDRMAPLQSFYFKTEMAFATGCIDRDLYDSLGVVRKIRNEFAHKIRVSFEREEIQSMILTLCDKMFPKPTSQHGAIQHLRLLLRKSAEKEKEKGSRPLFDYCVTSLQSRIVSLIDQMEIDLDLHDTMYGLLFNLKTLH